MLTTVAITDLRPTQISVGYREVAEKRRAWKEREGDDAGKFLGRHMIPVLSGPNGHPYVTDHHHLARALMEEGVEQVAVNVIQDLSHLAKPEFWVFCENRGLCHPYDADGARQDFGAIPKRIADLTDDPFRSLAGELRRAGGYAKETVPFAEFIWADFLRRRMKRAKLDKAFAAALTQALALAKSPDAAHMPGWCGPVSDT